jgi:hypothetical protein
MVPRLALGLALAFLLAGCAESNYSGSKVDTETAASRSQAIVIGTIVTSQKQSIPGNTFFTILRCQVRVQESIRGSLRGTVPVSYTLEGDSPVPFRPGDKCIFFLELDTLPNSGSYQAQKVLAATPDSVAALKSSVR